MLRLLKALAAIVIGTVLFAGSTSPGGGDLPPFRQDKVPPKDNRTDNITPPP